MRKPAARPSQVDLDRLADSFLALSAGDKSVLIGAVNSSEQNTSMMTATDSANFPLWTKLAELGWMERLELDEAFQQAGSSDQRSRLSRVYHKNKADHALLILRRKGDQGPSLGRVEQKSAFLPGSMKGAVGRSIRRPLIHQILLLGGQQLVLSNDTDEGA